MQHTLDGNRISYQKEDVINILKEIDYILCSLHRMGSYYEQNEREQYEKETTNFIDNSLVCSRLAKIRRVLDEGYMLALGNESMDELERMCEDIPYWEKTGDICDTLWLRACNNE